MAETSGKKAVLVSPDNAVLSRLSTVLHREGMEVSMHRRAVDCLEYMLAAPAPDLIVADMSLTDMEGWRFCRLLRSPEFGPLNRVPVLALSSLSGSDAPELIVGELGVDELLDPDAGPEVIRSRVAALAGAEHSVAPGGALIISRRRKTPDRLARDLEKAGYTVSRAATAERGLVLHESRRPALVLLDHRLPRPGVEAVLEGIREKDTRAVVLVISDDSGPGPAAWLMKLGADACLCGPVELDCMLKAVEETCKMRCLSGMESSLRRLARGRELSERRFRSLFENIPALVVVHDVSGAILQINSTGAGMLGWSRDELLFRGYEDILRQDQPCVFRLRIGETLSHGGCSFESVYRTRRGGEIMAEVHLSRFEYDGSDAVLAIAHDITARKRVESELARAQALLLSSIEQVPAGIVIADAPDARIRLVNSAARSIAGRVGMVGGGRLLRKRDFGGRFCHPDGSPYSPEEMPLVRAIAGGEHVENEEAVIIAADGSEHWVLINASPVKDDQGRIVAGVAVFPEITEMKNYERALRDSEQKYQRLTENIGDVVYTLDPESNLAYVSPQVERFGYSSRELLFRPFSGIVHEDDRQELEEHYRRTRSSGGEHCIQFRIIGKTGEVYWVEEFTRAQYNDRGEVTGLAGSIRDITLRKQLEMQRERGDKLESLGLLAGGIAHDFNNLLTAIIGNISIAQMVIGEEHETARMLADAEKAGLRAQDLTQQLLTFSKGGTPVKKLVSIEGLIRECAAFSLRGSNVKCRVEIAPELWPVEVDQGQISQVIGNLVINADQAMPDGGLLLLAAENVELGKGDPGDRQPGRYVRITVRDQGQGIAEENLPRIFDPYYTTKSGGSGLGLSTVYSVVRKHNGYVEVDSAPGGGTEFRVYLPASEDPVAGAEPPAKDGAGVDSANILVMDDEEAVLNVACRMLGKLGHVHECARDGAEAVELYTRAEEDGRPFDVVIMDLTVPGGMGGVEAVRRILEIEPWARVIVSSGYSNDPVLANYRDYGFSGLVSKPYTMESLEDALRSVLADRPRPPR